MNRTLVIAEAGVNHNGDMGKAREMIDAAVKAGADIVKFQSFKLDQLVSKSAQKASYQIDNTGEQEKSQYEMLKSLRLSLEDAQMLKQYCEDKGIKFLSTPFDAESAVELVKNDLIDMIKIPSGELVNLGFLRVISGFGLPVILSTGMASLTEVSQALDALLSGGKLSRNDITILHCNTEYPTPFTDVNLRAMLTMKEALKVNVGYSDHTLGIEIPVAAVALGASVIEKHFTLDKTMEGPDHAASLEPDELVSMVSAIRNIEVSMGDGIKQPSPSEQANIQVIRKSLHLKRALKAGDKIEASDLVSRRPADGISPMDIDKIIGMRVADDLEADTPLLWEKLK